MTTEAKMIDSPGIWDAFKSRLVARVDSWMNPWTGQGTARDKTAAGRFDPSLPLVPQECADLYHGDPIAARIVDLIPREMLRQGFSLERDDEADEAADDDQRVRDVEGRLRELDAQEVLLDGFIWGRCMGGALVFVGVDDGLDASKPLDPKRAKGISFLKVYDRRRVSVQQRYENPKLTKFGEPEIYRIDPIEGVSVGSGAGVHESRCIRFGGARTGEYERRTLDSWDYSVLQKVYEAIRRFHGMSASSEALMTDASQGVFYMSGYVDAITSGQVDRVFQRLIATDMGRSALRSMVVDADPKLGEKFEKVQTTFAGIGDMLDRGANYLSAATEIPVTVLMGQAPAGLSATGDADIRLFYDRVRTEQKNQLEPRILRLVEILTGGEVDGWRVCFPSLWQESPKERAERQKAEAERDVAYIDAEVVTPEEVALAPHLEEVYPNLDRELREVLEERATEQVLEEPKSEPPAPVPPGTVPSGTPAPAEPPA